VVAMPHARLGETVCAYVIPKKGRTLSFEEMLAHIAATGVARQKSPEKLVIVDDLPRTPSGKVRKDLLRSDIRARLQQPG
jgi:non-ribosomal peptide synthetase component E (peptide arylation enzyme)